MQDSEPNTLPTELFQPHGLGFKLFHTSDLKKRDFKRLPYLTPAHRGSVPIQVGSVSIQCNWWDSKFALKLLSQCGSTYKCPSKSVPEIRFAWCWDFLSKFLVTMLYRLCMHDYMELNMPDIWMSKQQRKQLSSFNNALTCIALRYCWAQNNCNSLSNMMSLKWTPKSSILVFVFLNYLHLNKQNQQLTNSSKAVCTNNTTANLKRKISHV